MSDLPTWQVGKMSDYVRDVPRYFMMQCKTRSLNTLCRFISVPFISQTISTSDGVVAAVQTPNALNRILEIARDEETLLNMAV